MYAHVIFVAIERSVSYDIMSDAIGSGRLTIRRRDGGGSGVGIHNQFATIAQLARTSLARRNRFSALSSPHEFAHKKWGAITLIFLRLRQLT